MRMLCVLLLVAIILGNAEGAKKEFTCKGGVKKYVKCLNAGYKSKYGCQAKDPKDGKVSRKCKKIEAQLFKTTNDCNYECKKQRDAAIKLSTPQRVKAGDGATIQCAVYAAEKDSSVELYVNGKLAKYNNESWDYLADKEYRNLTDGTYRTLIDGYMNFEASGNGTKFKCYSEKYNIQDEKYVRVYSNNSRNDTDDNKDDAIRWQPVERGVKYEFNNDTRPIMIKTYDTANGDDQVWLKYYWYVNGRQYWGMVRWRFSDYGMELYSCTNGTYDTLLTNVPDDKEKVWQINWDYKYYTIKCNGVTVWRFDFSMGKYKECAIYYQGGRGALKEFEFKEQNRYAGVDTASEYFYNAKYNGTVSGGYGGY